MTLFKMQRLAAIAMGLILTAAMLWLQFEPPPLLRKLPERLELMAFDLRMQSSPPLRRKQQTPTPIVIVDIDNTSLARHGRWPWSRNLVAEFTARLFTAGAAVVAFDVLFAEAEHNPVLDVSDYIRQHSRATPTLAATLQQLEQSFDYDGMFCAILRRQEVVLGYTFNPHANQHSGQLPQPLTVTNPTLVRSSSLPLMRGYTANLPAFTNAATGCGFFSLSPDIDGVIRRAPIVARFGNHLYASLALETVKDFLLVESVTLHANPINGRQTVEGVELNGHTIIPTNASGEMIVPYLGTQGSFPYIPAYQILAGTAPQHQLEGAIVLVGTTAPGLFDLRTSPLQSVYPGVEIHANLISAILEQRFLMQPAWAQGANFIIMAATGLLLALLLPFLAPPGQIICTLATAATLATANVVMWQHGLVLALAIPLLSIFLLAGTNLAYGFLFEARSRRQLKQMFGQYVPPQIVQQMSENPRQYSFDGETREMTVLFADIRGFTTLSESLSAAELKNLLNRYFTPMTRIIFQTGGTIDKYVGDMIMAFWGAPLADEKHASHAIEAAMLMLAETAQLREQFLADGLPRIAIGIGINTGNMNIGDMGSEFRRSYTVLGDAVNLGSRFEGTTKYYGVDLVVGQTTRIQAEADYIFRELDLVRVKGKTEAIHVYEPICRHNEATDEITAELATYHESVRAYQARNWAQAQAGFSSLQQQQPERRIYAIYLERIDQLRHNDPGPAWDGVYTRSEK